MVRIRQTRASSAGLTLVELLAVLAIIGVIAAMAAPRLWITIQQLKFSSETRHIVSTLRFARSLAVAENAQFGVYFNGTYNNSGQGNALKYTLFKDIKDLDEFEFNESGDSVIRIDTLTPGVTHMFTDLADEVIIFTPVGGAQFDGGGNIATMVDKPNVFEIRQINVLPTGRIKLTVL